MTKAWLIFVFMTVSSWGLYGVFLHQGQVAMADPVHGRYKAFLFVGLAYLLAAVIGSALMLVLNGSDWQFYRQRCLLVIRCRTCRRDRGIRCTPRLRCRGATCSGDVHCICRRAYCERCRCNAIASTRRRLE